MCSVSLALPWCLDSSRCDAARHQVRLVKMKGTEYLFAMKKLKKSEMIEKEQVPCPTFVSMCGLNVRTTS